MSGLVSLGAGKCMYIINHAPDHTTPLPRSGAVYIPEERKRGEKNPFFTKNIPKGEMITVSR